MSELSVITGTEAQEASFHVGQADCLEWLAAQPADSIDFILTSPPYEDVRLYLEDGTDLGIARGTDAWVAWMVQVYKLALRCCTGVVAAVVEGKTKNFRWSAAPALLIAALVREGITVRKPPIYYRSGIPGSGGPDWLRNNYELIVCATRGGRLPWSDNTAMGGPCVYDPGGAPSHRTRDGSRVNAVYRPPKIANPGNVIHCKAGGGNMGDELCHESEAPFSEHLAEFFIRTFCPPRGVVGDPFCGSGTVGAVAMRHGRRFVGCDIRQSQVDLSIRRISKVLSSLGATNNA
jgi:site-specific DNA-methyltransferase (adenine-specific)